MQSTFEKFISGTLALAAVAMSAAFVHRELSARPTGRAPAAASYARDWRDALPAAHAVGNPQASVRVVVFSDFECPFCKGFHNSLRTVLQKHPEEVAYSFVHFPLAAHKHALGAAQTAECAGATGDFAAAVDFIFMNQDSLGRRDWAWFANGAGVTDSAGFRQCMSRGQVAPLIEEGIAIGATLQVVGTPAVFLNGWRYPGAPPEAEFVRAVDDLVAGRKPYADFPTEAIRANKK